PERLARGDAVDRLILHLGHIPLVLFLVLREELDRGRILGQPGFTFDDHRLVGALGRNDTARILCEVAGFARALAGAEVEAAINPHPPDDHGVRRSIRSRSRDPVIVRFLQALFGPFPRQQALSSFRNAVAWHMWTSSLRLCPSRR